MRRRRVALGLLILSGVALVVRAVHLGWGLPMVYEEASPVREAVGFWGTVGRGLDLNPHFFKYPSFTFYLNFLLQAIWFLWLSIIGAVSSLNDFRQVLSQHLDHAVLLGRWLQAVTGALVVVPTFHLGRKLGGLGAGWIAAGLMAVIPVAVTESRLVAPDMSLTLFAAAALVSATRIAERGERSDYLWCGLWIGLAAASKYPGAFLLAALLAAHVRTVTIRREGPVAVVFSGLLWQALFTAGVVFVAASPYVLFDASAAAADIGFERRHMALGHLGRERGVAILYYLGHAIPRGWTVVVAIAAVVGIVLLLARRESRGKALPGAVFAATALVIFGSWKMAAPRYILPLVPLAAAWAGAAVVGVARSMPGPRAATRGALILLAAVTVGWPLVRVVRALDQRDRPDSRTAAEAWIHDNVPPGSTILVERYGPKPDPGRYRVLYLPFHGITPHIYDPAYSPPLYATFDYAVFSSGVYARYLADPRQYPAETAFYAEMNRAFDEQTVFSSDDYQGPTVRILKRDPRADLKDLAEIPQSFFDGLAGQQELAEYFSALGTVLVRQGSDSLGFRMLREAVGMVPDDARAWGNLGAMQLRIGRSSDAYTSLREAKRLAPRDPEVAYNLGIYFARSGEASQAIDAFREALGLKPDFEEAYIGLARALIQDDEYAEARGVLRAFLDRFPRSSQRSAAESALAELAKMGPGKRWAGPR
jgi:hypothetical protein